MNCEHYTLKFIERIGSIVCYECADCNNQFDIDLRDMKPVIMEDEEE